MTFLKTFEWGYVFDDRAASDIPGLWDALRACLELKDIKVDDGGCGLGGSVSHSQLFSLQGIETFDFETNIGDQFLGHPDPDSEPHTEHIIDFLATNRGLHTIRLSFSYCTSYDYFFDTHSVYLGPTLADVRLPHLHTLKLSFIECDPRVFCDFLTNNPTIQILDLYTCFPYAYTGGKRPDILVHLEEGALPNLQDYAGGCYTWKSLCRAGPHYV
ncbi:hypothetical protein JAAARDRAFT_59127 [Jaapia argillacea MUCL 33604]|uniref:Uncharacterized protein n=1 Tax=Jaapia argillacea MUCL 33604 TaxID=933084 RepID=A0A067PN43_9AGAM|nr:hypothetical protein JAAARDRAFT_59127 [Jaapia argillacea MUCL 33604]